MPNYDDAYLKDRITLEIETKAAADVDALDLNSDFSASWTEQLTVTRAYIRACMIHQANADDLFTAKMESYRKEFDKQLAMAKADAAATSEAAGNEVSPLFFTIPMERG